MHIWLDLKEGNDSNDGSTPESAVLTFARVDELIVSGRCDVVYQLPCKPSVSSPEKFSE